MSRPSCFKAYDIRGKVGPEIDADLALRLGQAIAARLSPGSVAIGRDVRESSPMLAAALAEGLSLAGVEVWDLGLCGTEEVYFATSYLGAGAGIMVTASHNPIEYNGFKLVGPDARPLTETEYHDIGEQVGTPRAVTVAQTPGRVRRVDIRHSYIDRVMSFVDPTNLSPMRVVVNAGNGAAGPTFDALATALSAAGARLDFCRVHHEPDPTFPNGIPNPLLPENHAATGDVVRAMKADFGVAWDGDFDRCFFFDETGTVVPGEYVVGLLARTMLERHPESAIVHDPRIVWNTQDVVQGLGGHTVQSPVGHVFMKDHMRRAKAPYGGEISAHHYFRDFMYCDSGMIPLVLIAALLSRSGRSLGQEVLAMRQDHPSSDEINFRVHNPAGIIAEVRRLYETRSLSIDTMDGLGIAFSDWRFNLRMSNTEPLLRLNLETRGSRHLLAAKIDELSTLIATLDGQTGTSKAA